MFVERIFAINWGFELVGDFPMKTYSSPEIHVFPLDI